MLDLALVASCLLLALALRRLGLFQLRPRRLGSGAEVYHQLHSHVVDIVRRNNEAYRADGSDRYLYGAPVLLLKGAATVDALYDGLAPRLAG